MRYLRYVFKLDRYFLWNVLRLLAHDLQIHRTGTRNNNNIINERNMFDTFEWETNHRNIVVACAIVLTLINV